MIFLAFVANMHNPRFSKRVLPWSCINLVVFKLELRRRRYGITIVDIDLVQMLWEILG